MVLNNSKLSPLQWYSGAYLALTYLLYHNHLSYKTSHLNFCRKIAQYINYARARVILTIYVTSKVSSSHVITSPFILKNFNNLYIKGFSFGLKKFKISSSARIPLAKILLFFIKFDFFLCSLALAFNSYLIECFGIVRSFCFWSSCNFGFLMGGDDDFSFSS